jgi:cytochrome c oxidase subunit IV
MPPGLYRLLFGWIALILLLGLEFGVSFLDMPASLRPVLLIVAAAMVMVIAFVFMQIGRGPVLVRGFAVMAIFWMIVLIGLGSMDPLTRLQYFTKVDRPM